MQIIRIVACAMVLGSVGATSAAAQQTAPAKPAVPVPLDPGTVVKGWQPPRTPWGDPDLQGVYSRLHLFYGAVPFERSPEFGTRAELTEAELKARMDARDKASGQGLNRPTGTSFDDEISPYLKPSRQTSIVIDPPDGRLPPFTPEGQKRVDAARRKPTSLGDIGPEMFNIEERCLSRSFPATMNPATPTSAGMQLIQGPGWVVLHFELLNEYRLVPLTPRPPLGPKLRQWWGQSRGRWEGTTLVVEVTNFGGRAVYRLRGAEFPVGERLRVIERFTPISYGEIQYQYTVEDPDTFTRPWTIRASWGRHNQLEITEYACHPGNRDLPKMIVIAQDEFIKANSKAPPSAPGQPR